MSSQYPNLIRSLAKRLWDVDWKLPWTLGEFSIREGTFAEALPFILEHYPTIFGANEGSRFLVEPLNDAKRRFGDEMDVFLFSHRDRLIGISMGNAQDWSTYYVRSTAILSDYRNHNLGGQWIARTCEMLRDAGVTRVEADCSPMNAPVLKALANVGFVVTSSVASERWGMNLKLTKFLRQDAEQIFAERFCQVTVPNRNAR